MLYTGEEMSVYRSLLTSCFFLAKKLPKNEPQNAPGGPGRNRVVDLQESSQPSRSQCCSN